MLRLPPTPIGSEHLSETALKLAPGAAPARL